MDDGSVSTVLHSPFPIPHFQIFEMSEAPLLKQTMVSSSDNDDDNDVDDDEYESRDLAGKKKTNMTRV